MSATERPEKALDGRTAAVLAVTDALTGRQFVNEALRAMRAAGDLSGREAALAMEIGQGAVRHLITSEHVLGAVARFRKAHTAPRLRAILSTAAYQIIWMDRIPPFAAADQAVGLAKRLVGGRSPGMVNAVLRRLTGAIVERSGTWQRLDPQQVRVSWERACAFANPVLPRPGSNGEALAHLAAATGERSRRYAELCARYGPEQAEAAAWASQAVPVTVLQRNPRRATPEAFEQCLRSACGEVVAFAGDTAYVPPSVPVVDTPAFRDGLLFVQDRTAHAAAEAVGAQPGERVLDLCAAPGGKSVALALAMDDRGLVLACDTDQQRLRLVDANVARLGLTCIHTRRFSPEDLARPSAVAKGFRVQGSEFSEAICESVWLAKKLTVCNTELADRTQPFDAALVDVPCSNTGVIARRPEARLGLTTQKLGSLVETQRELLRRAARHVRPGGRLVYSTCSVEPEENEQVIAAFLAANPHWRLDVEKTTLPAWGPRLSDWRDGGYYARLRRADSPE
ncbi:MAG: hypothetical protein KAY37_14430 [Phycisphaerae bacterium]|nr:hypothetical protein [Phycisphaerae bacterium]